MTRPQVTRWQVLAFFLTRPAPDPPTLGLKKIWSVGTRPQVNINHTITMPFLTFLTRPQVTRWQVLAFFLTRPAPDPPTLGLKKIWPVTRPAQKSSTRAALPPGTLVNQNSPVQIGLRKLLIDFLINSWKSKAAHTYLRLTAPDLFRFLNFIEHCWYEDGWLLWEPHVGN